MLCPFLGHGPWATGISVAVLRKPRADPAPLRVLLSSLGEAPHLLHQAPCVAGLHGPTSTSWPHSSPCSKTQKSGVTSWVEKGEMREETECDEDERAAGGPPWRRPPSCPHMNAQFVLVRVGNGSEALGEWGPCEGAIQPSPTWLFVEGSWDCLS